jgi:hypothetical protein
MRSCGARGWNWRASVEPWKTMPGHFAEFLSGGNKSPGVVVISQKANLGVVIESIVLLWAASDPSEWENRIFDLPM